MRIGQRRLNEKTATAKGVGMTRDFRWFKVGFVTGGGVTIAGGLACAIAFGFTTGAMTQALDRYLPMALVMACPAAVFGGYLGHLSVLVRDKGGLLALRFDVRDLMVLVLIFAGSFTLTEFLRKWDDPDVPPSVSRTPATLVASLVSIS